MPWIFIFVAVMIDAAVVLLVAAEMNKPAGSRWPSWARLLAIPFIAQMLALTALYGAVRGLIRGPARRREKQRQRRIDRAREEDEIEKLNQESD